jgi:hypothetical protein
LARLVAAAVTVINLLQLLLDNNFVTAHPEEDAVDHIQIVKMDAKVAMDCFADLSAHQHIS